MSIGAWEEPDMGVNQSILPTSPTGVVGVATVGSGGTAGQQESPELTLEYWSPKGQSQKVYTIAFNCIAITCIITIVFLIV